MDYSRMFLVPEDLYHRLIGCANEAERRELDDVNSEFSDNPLNSTPIPDNPPPDEIPANFSRNISQMSYPSIPNPPNESSANTPSNFELPSDLDNDDGLEDPSSTLERSRSPIRQPRRSLLSRIDEASSTPEPNQTEVTADIRGKKRKFPDKSPQNRKRKRRNIGDLIEKLHARISDIQKACIDGLLSRMKKLDKTQEAAQRKKINDEFAPLHDDVDELNSYSEDSELSRRLDHLERNINQIASNGSTISANTANTTVNTPANTSNSNSQNISPPAHLASSRQFQPTVNLERIPQHLLPPLETWQSFQPKVRLKRLSIKNYPKLRRGAFLKAKKKISQQAKS